MGSLSCFLAQNVKKRTTKKVILSDRFVDEEGNPVAWEIRSVSAGEDEALRKECTKKVPIAGRRNSYTQDFDSNKYLTLLASKAVVFPDLNNTELQNSYSVMCAEDLVKTMLYKDEFDKLTEEITSVSEAEDVNELVEEAKN